jgi:hypothetical protein
MCSYGLHVKALIDTFGDLLTLLVLGVFVADLFLSGS